MTRNRTNATPSKNYPTPDPAWEYAQTWEAITEAHQKLEELIKYLSSEDCEMASERSDRQILASLQIISANLEGAADCFNS